MVLNYPLNIQLASDTNIMSISKFWDTSIYSLYNISLFKSHSKVVLELRSSQKNLFVSARKVKPESQLESHWYFLFLSVISVEVVTILTKRLVWTKWLQSAQWKWKHGCSSYWLELWVRPSYLEWPKKR